MDTFTIYIPNPDDPSGFSNVEVTAPSAALSLEPLAQFELAAGRGEVAPPLPDENFYDWMTNVYGSFGYNFVQSDPTGILANVEAIAISPVRIGTIEIDDVEYKVAELSFIDNVGGAMHMVFVGSAPPVSSQYDLNDASWIDLYSYPPDLTEDGYIADDYVFPSIDLTPYLNTSAPCFTRGTLIETERGLVAVEGLCVGDMVRTKDRGYQPVRWIGSKALKSSDLTRKPKLRPIRIKAGAMGLNAPAQDLLVSPQHRMALQSDALINTHGAKEMLAAATHLTDLDGIDVAHDISEVEYFHILFDQHELIYANGAETESLFTGPQAIKSLPPAAVDEIFGLFPELRDRNYSPALVRACLTGQQARNMIARHMRDNTPLTAAA